MNIAIIGYGKMGKAIHRLMKEHGHYATLIITAKNQQEFSSENLEQCDVAIEFSTPETGFENIYKCIKAGIPVISGTTGWLDKMDEVHRFCEEKNGAFLYAPNFSIGVNIFFELNKQLAKLMKKFPQYKAEISETHHIQKIDAPSGTGIEVANGIIANSDYYESWSKEAEAHRIRIVSHREGDVPGTHSTDWTSEVDKISIQHDAFTRDSFAKGALTAAEWIVGKKGIFTMSDLLKLG